MKSFKQWTEQELRKDFGLTRAPNGHELLKKWLASNIEPSDEEHRQLLALQSNIQSNAEYWNEEELKMKFISPFLAMTHLDTDAYRTFYNRSLSGKIGRRTMGGIVDMFVASGFQTPEEPYFFFHEYKQERVKDGDPLGQLLASMLTGQVINNEKFPLYGCYIVGRFWYFVVLKNKEYAVSLAFDATKQDLFQIFSCIRQVKKDLDAK